NIIADYITNLKQFDVQNNKMILIEENFDDFYNKIMDKWKVYNQDQCIQAINILKEVTKDNKNQRNRIKVVEFFTTLLSSDSLRIRSAVLTPLTVYRLSDYKKEAKNNIEKLFDITNEIYLRSEIYKLAGFLQLQEAERYLIERYFNKKEKADRWNAMLSLARMGNKKALDFCIRKMKKDISKQNKFGYPSNIEEDAYYIRQPETLNLLLKISGNKSLVSDISKPSVKSNLGHLALSYVEISITNFPSRLYKEEGKSYEERIRLIEKWLKENKNNLILNKGIY
ncbi:hypothetical protein V3A08_04030, partial [Tenacibaculum maritimum]